eukprot:scaffold154693_cov31-Tisochrysis_lutea.AAC.2
MSFSRSSNPVKKGVVAPTSSAWHETARRWLRMRVISRNIVRITCTATTNAVSHGKDRIATFHEPHFVAAKTSHSCSKSMALGIRRR